MSAIAANRQRQCSLLVLDLYDQPKAERGVGIVASALLEMDTTYAKHTKRKSGDLTMLIE
jgi:hypothetical protein